MEPLENTVVALESFEKIILRWDSIASKEARESMIFDGDCHEINHYLQAIDEIQHSMESAMVEDDHHQAKANSAIQIAMDRLEDEFHNILIAHIEPIETDSLLNSSSSFVRSTSKTNSTGGDLLDEDYTDDDSTSKETELTDGGVGVSTTTLPYRSTNSIREIDLIPSEPICDLQSIVERMISTEYLRECVQVYGIMCKSAVDTSFWRLGIEKLSIGNIQRLE